MLLWIGMRQCLEKMSILTLYSMTCYVISEYEQKDAKVKQLSNQVWRVALKV